MTVASIVMAGVLIVALAVVGWLVREGFRGTRRALDTAVNAIRSGSLTANELREIESDPSGLVRDLFREVIVVTLKTGETFRGVLVAADSHALLLREAMQLAQHDAVSIDGELIVPRVDVAYLQRP